MSMGFFVYAHVVEGTADKDGVTLTTSVLKAHPKKKALFYWSEGERPGKLFSFASDTLHCTSKLSVLRGYPDVERRGNKPGENENLIQIEKDFRSEFPHDAVLFHFLLPPRFVPSPNLRPLVTPSLPSIIVRGDRLSATFVATGAADVRFWIKRLEPKESLADFELTRLFAKPAERFTKATWQVNFGVVKFGFRASLCD
jgi:hypothetical protein